MVWFTFLGVMEFTVHGFGFVTDFVGSFVEIIRVMVHYLGRNEVSSTRNRG